MDDPRTNREGGGGVTMPRFRVGSLLILFAFVAMWLSTFAKYTGSEDVRHGLRLLIAATSVVAAYCNGGRARAFWMGFAAIWILYYLSSPAAGPKLFWVQAWVENDGPFPDSDTSVVMDTVRTGSILILAIVAGLIGIYSYGPERAKE
jgi:hypothetical protein